MFRPSAQGNTSQSLNLRSAIAVALLVLVSVAATLVLYPAAPTAQQFIFATMPFLAAVYVVLMALLFSRVLSLRLGGWTCLVTLALLTCGEVAVRAGLFGNAYPSGEAFVMDHWQAWKAQRDNHAVAGNLDCGSVMTLAGEDFRSWLYVLYGRTELTDTHYPIDAHNGALLTREGIAHTVTEADNHDLARRQWSDELRHGKQVMHTAIDGLAPDRLQRGLQRIDTIFDVMIAAQKRQDALADDSSRALHTFLATVRDGTPGAMGVVNPDRYTAKGPLASRIMDDAVRLNAARKAEGDGERETRRVIAIGIGQLAAMFPGGGRPGPSPLCSP